MKSPYECVLDNFEAAADALVLSAETRSVLRNPERVLEIDVPIRCGNGVIENRTGYRVQHNTLRGPAMGGVRCHPSVTLDEVKALAMCMTWRWAVLGIPFGGGTDGVLVDLNRLPAEERERLTRCTLNGEPPVSGEKNTANATDYMRHSEAAGASVLHSTVAACAYLGISLKQARVTARGFGATGMAAARYLSGAGAVVVGAGDTRGSIYSASGLDIPKLIRHKERTGSVVGFAGSEPITDDELLAVDCEILVAATVKHAIHRQNASAIRAKIVAEATDGSVTPKGDHALARNGVFVIPDILCNSGGGIVAYCEWAQEPNVYGQLEQTIQRSFHDVLEMSLGRKVNIRRAAHMLGISRVAESIGNQAQCVAAAHRG